MDSSQPFASSPISPTTRLRRRSKYTYKHLSTLANGAPTSPLRVIAHIDLDAFYAQCETIRLGLDPTKPLAVQQWQGLIAINYPARAFGLNRHVTVAEAKEKCPELICQHVATWKEGDVTWNYGDGDEAFREIASRKVSLDPYRLQSRKILATIKEFLPVDVQKVEKASIDEVFLDLSAQVHGIMLERYPELKGPPPYDDPSEPLVRPPTTALDWAADALVDLDKEQSEEDDPDWDDVAILIASEIVRDVRAEIFKKLHYTCSAGISKNKMLAKLGSAHKKPNSQTVIRNRAVQHFLSDFKFTKIRNLGGKLGDEIVAAFNTDTVAELLSVPIEQFKKTLSEDTGSWLYNIIRGEDNSEVNPRTQIKSMLSAKSFRPSINTLDVASKWLRIFVADIYSRLVEEGVLENKRRPKTMNLHHRQGAQTRSKSSPIPLGRAITEEGLFDLAKNLLAQVVVDGRAWPCANLSLSVGGFEEGVQGNQGIGSFLVRGEDAKALQNAQPRAEATPPPPAKRRRVDNGGGITRFFGMREDSRDSNGGGGGVGSNHEQRQETPQHTSHEDTATTTTPARAKPLFFLNQDVAAKNSDPQRAGHEEMAVSTKATPQAQNQPHSRSKERVATWMDQVGKLQPPPSAQNPVIPRANGTNPRGQDEEDEEEEEEEEDDDEDWERIFGYDCPRCNGHFSLEDRLDHKASHLAHDKVFESAQDIPPSPPPPDDEEEKEKDPDCTFPVKDEPEQKAFHFHVAQDKLPPLSPSPPPPPIKKEEEKEEKEDLHWERTFGYDCPRCKITISFKDKLEHKDWHFAQDLQDENPVSGPRPIIPPRAPVASSKPPAATAIAGGSRGGAGGTRGRGRGRPSAMSSGPERGQKRLNF
jgi:DNA polymerase eta